MYGSWLAHFRDACTNHPASNQNTIVDGVQGRQGMNGWCNTLQRVACVIPFALYAPVQFRFELSGARCRRCEDGDARRMREEDTRPLIHARCFYRRVGRDSLARSMDNLTHSVGLNGL